MSGAAISLNNNTNRHRTQIGSDTEINWLGWVILGVILLTGLALRIYTSGTDLPYFYDPDEPRFVRTAIGMMTRDSFNPGWFGHPGSTTIYLNLVVYKLIFEIGSLIGRFENFDDFMRYYYKDPTLFYLIPRLFYAAFGTAVAAVTFFATRLAFGVPAALLAALLVVLNPLQLTFVQIIRTDVLATLFVMLVAWQAGEIIRRNDLRPYLLAGIFIGLGVATKYPAVVVCVLVPAAHILAGRMTTQWWKVVAAAAASLFACFLASPYLFLDYATVLINLKREMRLTHPGATGEGFVENLIWYSVALKDEFGWPLLIVAFIGVFAAFHEQRKTAILYMLFPLAFLAFISGLSLRWVRWLIPMLPFVALFAAGGAAFIVRVVAVVWNDVPRTLLMLLLSVIIVAHQAEQTARIEAIRAAEDTRNVARRWIVENIPRGSRVLVEVYTPHLPRKRFRIYEPMRAGSPLGIMKTTASYRNVAAFGSIGAIDSLDDIDRLGIEYVILGPALDKARAELPKAAALYEDLLRRGEVIHTVERTASIRRGPTVRVLKLGHLSDGG